MVVTPNYPDNYPTPQPDLSEIFQSPSNATAQFQRADGGVFLSSALVASPDSIQLEV